MPPQSAIQQEVEEHGCVIVDVGMADVQPHGTVTVLILRHLFIGQVEQGRFVVMVGQVVARVRLL